ncbi:MAG: hypothetical protein BWY76_02453 [bacterium ADurb.Bin429]|nr:MAG: hypothetical protein BWY76_02453 [bacterium ADurb.Bin429]
MATVAFDGTDGLHHVAGIIAPCFIGTSPPEIRLVAHPFKHPQAVASEHLAEFVAAFVRRFQWAHASDTVGVICIHPEKEAWKLFPHTLFRIAHVAGVVAIHAVEEHLAVLRYEVCAKSAGVIAHAVPAELLCAGD